LLKQNRGEKFFRIRKKLVINFGKNKEADSMGGR
jgi:hypothetical protein